MPKGVIGKQAFTPFTSVLILRAVVKVAREINASNCMYI